MELNSSSDLELSMPNEMLKEPLNITNAHQKIYVEDQKHNGGMLSKTWVELLSEMDE